MATVTAQILLILGVASSPTVCSDASNEQAVKRTESLIVEKVDLEVSGSPVLHEPKVACVRLGFLINQSGRASDIVIEYTSGDRKFDIAAITALKKFKFVNACSDESYARSVLVFSGIVQ